jgi:hypothetical protein
MSRRAGSRDPHAREIQTYSSGHEQRLTQANRPGAELPPKEPFVEGQGCVELLVLSTERPIHRARSSSSSTALRSIALLLLRALGSLLALCTALLLCSHAIGGALPLRCDAKLPCCDRPYFSAQAAAQPYVAQPALDRRAAHAQGRVSLRLCPRCCSHSRSAI